MSPHAITTASQLRIDLLGPVTVSCDGHDVTLPPLELNLLVVLALTPGVTVSTDRLVDALWGSRLPVAPRTRVQALVSGLRRKVGDVVQTRYPGYVLDSARLTRDVDECDRLAAAARAADGDERLGLLDAAYAVWRGEPLDGIATAGVAPERTRLCEQRLGLLVARGETELALGRHRELVGVLAPAVAEHPLAEQLAGLYITALYRSNRQADALAAYEAIRERLADELGADAGQELQDLHGRILRGEVLPGPDVAPTPRRVPAQLPAPDGSFVGRGVELAAIGAAGAPIVVVSGAGGIGKTAVALAWAQGAADDHPDGQLFLHLGERGPGELVSAALVALGVPAAQVPEGAGERAGLFRTETHRRRLLVVADDATTVEQVLALVPSGPESHLVVTTRRRLPMLAMHHEVLEVLLAPLGGRASSALLGRVAGRDRLSAADATTLTDWCAGWPLLLRHAAATLAGRPSQSAADLVAELALQPVPEGLVAAYDELSPDGARLFERLGLVDGALCLHAAALVAGTTTHRARALLDELVDLHLVVEGPTGEFSLHEVVGRYARRLAVEREWSVVSPAGPAGCPACLLSRASMPASVAPARVAVPV